MGHGTFGVQGLGTGVIWVLNLGSTVVACGSRARIGKARTKAALGGSFQGRQK